MAAVGMAPESLHLLDLAEATFSMQRMNEVSMDGNRRVEDPRYVGGTPGTRFMKASKAPSVASPKFATPSTRVSVIIPTRDRPACVRRCLESILRCDGGVDFEILVMDQSTRCDTMAAIAAIGDPRVRYYHLPRPGKSRALNAALAEARHEFLALVDDDVEVDSGWLASGTAILGFRTDVGLVFGSVLAAKHDESMFFVPEFRPTRERLIESCLALALPGAGMGANAFTRRAAVTHVGGWDENLGPGSSAGSGDDWSLAYRLLRRGTKVLVTDRLVVEHHGARPYADGSARRLIQTNYQGIGTGLARYVLHGDCVAAVVLAKAFCRCAALAVRNAASGRRPVGFRALVGLVRGVSRACDERRRAVPPPRRPAERSAYGGCPRRTPDSPSRNPGGGSDGTGG